MSLPAVSKHLKVLEGAGLIARRRDGRVHHIDLEEQPLVAAERWIEDTRNFWQSRLDRLERFLHAPDKTKED